MKEKNITVVSRGDRSRGKTDWKKVEKLTDAQIDAAMTNDPEWAGFADIDWSDAVLVVPPKKIAISIRVDEDVLKYFRQSGTGYQKRMNAVLRSFVQQHKGKKRA